MATRAELRQPGMLERTFGGMSGGMLTGSTFGNLVAGFVGSVIAQQFFDSDGGDAGWAEGDVGDQAGSDPSGFGDDFGVVVEVSPKRESLFEDELRLMEATPLDQGTAAGERNPHGHLPG